MVNQFALILDNDAIHWNVSTNLRHSPVALVITATGERNATSEYRPRIYYCGCQKESECDYSLIQEDAPVYGSGMPKTYVVEIKFCQFHKLFVKSRSVLVSLHHFNLLLTVNLAIDRTL